MAKMCLDVVVYKQMSLAPVKIVLLSSHSSLDHIQFISIPDERYDEYRRSSDFIKEYIFPGGCLPSLSRITSAMSTSSRLWLHNASFPPSLLPLLSYYSSNCFCFHISLIAVWSTWKTLAFITTRH